MKQDIKYHGLKNQGATCYLNSVLQVLFMTTEFREAVERCSKHSEDALDVQLHTLFESLKKKTSETTEVTRKLGIEKVIEQHDAGQYFEKILSLVSNEASKIFEGHLIHRTICCKCDSETEDDVPFWFLSLPLMDSSDKHYSVVDGIREFLKDAEFDGDDQLYCENCDDKCDTTVKYELRHHPEVLMLLLKRFEYQYMSYTKDSRAVDVYYTINIPETYELYALVEHFGTLKGGHYKAKIKPQDEDRWYEFNDSSVTLLHNMSHRNKSEKSRSAHLLFYRKKNTGTQDKENKVEEGRRKLKDDDLGENDHLMKKRKTTSDSTLVHRQTGHEVTTCSTGHSDQDSNQETAASNTEAYIQGRLRLRRSWRLYVWLLLVFVFGIFLLVIAMKI
ncbi:ubiquitin carboxyl-terminal hydrolase 47-like isoform X2 [Girardinichthys multiradiatus]|uniref:ubiquitin carboxyl-terminal hydrolase 47-like isoform X2 n=1 Tax=Girardinichthys multiradiatus TaxID=208333 RepID=UPI001FAD0E94|nr:ubiquitin carboxyl-terminal hydrolase 47-like isoform X2 [Girardinichthys multiradiatus]